MATVRRAFDRGIRFFDTAPTYGDSERLIGRALAEHRDEVMLATKVGPNDDAAASLAASLRRLRTDRVDILQLHEVGERFEESLLTMARLREAGKALHVGLSNAAPPQMRRAIEIAGIEGYQGPYNVFDRDVEQRILPLCRDEGVAFLAYRPLASGLLSGGFAPEPPSFPEGDHRSRIYWFRGREYDRRQRVIARLRRLAEGRETSLPALALGWVLSRPGVRTVLAGAKTPAQVDQNASAMDKPLEPDIVGEIDAVVAEVFRPPVAAARARELAGEWGPRERFIIERLDGSTLYEHIATEWSDQHTPSMTSAQVKVFADQLVELGLATSEQPREKMESR
jgi:myo-inositol catabolism protein IolS